MAEDKKITKTENVAKSTPAAGAASKTVAASIPAKKATEKPEVKPVAKPAAKPAAKSVAAAPAKNGTAAKKAAPQKETAKRTRKKDEVALDATDTVKKALWDKISKAKAKKIVESIAIQVEADGLDSFYISVEEGAPHIERHYYYGNSGHFKASADELLKIAAGNYDVIASVKAGKSHFDGNLAALLKIIDLF